MLHADKYIFLVNESNNGMHCTINVIIQSKTDLYCTFVFGWSI